MLPGGQELDIDTHADNCPASYRTKFSSSPRIEASLLILKKKDGNHAQSSYLVEMFIRPAEHSGNGG